MPAQSHSLTQAAALLGLHRNTLAGWLTSKGCPAIRRADKTHGVDWDLSLAAIFEWRCDFVVKEAAASYGHADGHVTKEEADRRRALALAIVSEIEADTALESVVLRADAEAVMADFCQALRSAIDNATQKIAGRTAGMGDPNEIRECCERELNRAFEGAREDLEQLWNDVGSGRSRASEDEDERA